MWLLPRLLATRARRGRCPAGHESMNAANPALERRGRCRRALGRAVRGGAPRISAGRPPEIREGTGHGGRSQKNPGRAALWPTSLSAHRRSSSMHARHVPCGRDRPKKKKLKSVGRLGLAPRGNGHVRRVRGLNAAKFCFFFSFFRFFLFSVLPFFFFYPLFPPFSPPPSSLSSLFPPPRPRPRPRLPGSSA